MEMEIGNTKMQRVRVFKDKDYQAFKTNIPQRLARFLAVRSRDNTEMRIEWYIDNQTYKVSLKFVEI